jgi:hypothetical protein
MSFDAIDKATQEQHVVKEEPRSGIVFLDPDYKPQPTPEELEEERRRVAARAAHSKAQAEFSGELRNKLYALPAGSFFVVEDENGVVKKMPRQEAAVLVVLGKLKLIRAED